MMQLMRSMNRLLDKQPQARRRHLSWHTPVIVPVYPQVPSLAPLSLQLWLPPACDLLREEGQHAVPAAGQYLLPKLCYTLYMLYLL
jgi:hypothetical protein